MKDIKWEDLIKGDAIYEARYPEWVKAHDCLKGEAQIKSKREEYLRPTGTVMKQQLGEGHFGSFRGGGKYDEYLQNASFVNFTKGTVNSYVGSLVRKPVEVENIGDTALKDFTDNIDMNNTSIQEAVTKTLEEDVTTGRAGVLVDFPAKGELNARSYPVQLQAHQILATHKELLNGSMVYTFIKLKFVETIMNKDETGYINQEVVCVLKLDKAGFYFVTKYRKDTEGEGDNPKAIADKPIYPTSNGSKVGSIPVWITGDGETSLVSGVVDQNIGHYVAWAKLKRLLGTKGTPVFLATYPEGSELSKPTQTALQGAAEVGFADTDHVFPYGSDMKFVEPTGAGASKLRQDVKDHEELIGKLGAFHLLDSKGGVESNATLKTKAAGQMSGLNMTAHRVGELWANVLNFLLKHWETTDKSKGAAITVKINRDYLPVDLDPAVLKELRESFGAGGVIVYNYMNKTDALPKDITSYKEYEEAIEEVKEPVQEAPEVPEDPILPTKEEVDDETPKDKDK